MVDAGGGECCDAGGRVRWDTVEARSQSGVTWTEESYFAVGGHYTPGEALGGTLVMTQPVSADPPEGFTPPEFEDTGFPQLCDDPTADLSDLAGEEVPSLTGD